MIDHEVQVTQQVLWNDAKTSASKRFFAVCYTQFKNQHCTALQRLDAWDTTDSRFHHQESGLPMISSSDLEVSFLEDPKELPH